VTSEFDFDRNKEAGLDFSFGKRKVVSRERECYVLDGGWREREREKVWPMGLVLDGGSFSDLGQGERVLCVG
jgi:hypothetical protein